MSPRPWPLFTVLALLLLLVLQVGSHPTQNAPSLSITSQEYHALVERAGKGKGKATAPKVPEVLPFPAFTYNDLRHDTIQEKVGNKKYKTTTVTTYLSPQKDKGYGDPWATLGEIGRKFLDLWEGHYGKAQDIRIACFYWAPLNIQVPGYYTIYTQSASNKFKPDHPERATIFNEVNTQRLGNHWPSLWHAEPLACLKTEKKAQSLPGYSLTSGNTYPRGSIMRVVGRQHGVYSNNISPCGSTNEASVDPTCHNTLHWLGVATWNNQNPYVAPNQPPIYPPQATMQAPGAAAPARSNQDEYGYDDGYGAAMAKYSKHYGA